MWSPLHPCGQCEPNPRLLVFVDAQKTCSAKEPGDLVVRRLNPAWRGAGQVRPFGWYLSSIAFRKRVSSLTLNKWTRGMVLICLITSS